MTVNWLGNGADKTNSVRLRVAEMSQVGEARRIASGIAVDLGFDATREARAAIVVTEAATNLVRHAKGGEVLLRRLERDHIGGLEILALDRGPGMRDVAECMRDGYSTGGTNGTGLGAIRRLADLFDIHSSVGLGTVLCCQLWSQSPATSQGKTGLESAAICLAMHGQSVCGDAWAVETAADSTRMMVADGLGHGPLAAIASQAAIQVFRDRLGLLPADLLRQADRALRTTRGAAVAVAHFDAARQEVRFAGVGNVVGTMVSAAGGHTGMISHNGTIGLSVPKLQEFVYPWPAGSMLVLHTDGLSSKWRLDKDAGILSRHPSLIGGLLYREHSRIDDDMTVFVAKRAGSELPA